MCINKIQLDEMIEKQDTFTTLQKKKIPKHHLKVRNAKFA